MNDSALIAATEAGQIRGAVEDGIFVFKGVRYGADTATTRFAAPRRPDPWSGIADTLAFGASALQPPGGDSGGLNTSWRPNSPLAMSEDCLFLNVWTPGLADGAKRPVMFWLHGGRFSTGSGSNNAYNGVRLAKRGDVVVITVNHRLNLFGHLYLAEFGADFADSGNASILDLILALEWVRDNAASFGGDPGNVTIFGESGGAAKVSVLMAMSAAQGLFHRTIVQSGPLLQVIPAEQAAEATRAVVAKLGLTAATADRLRTMPAADIQAAAREVAAAGASVNLMGQLGGIAGGPVLDGRNVKHHPFHPQAAPEGRSVPMLIGVNRTETSLLIGAARPALFDLTFDNLPAALAPQFPEFDIEAIIAGYRKLHPACNPAAVFFAITSDRSFLRLSIALADRKADQGGAPTYFYLLDWDTPVDGGKWLCPHALDIPFVFDNVATSASMCGIGAEQQRLADIMSETWLAFARAGDPNNELVPEWPAYDARRRPVMVFDLPPYLIDDPRAAERALFSPATQRVPA